MNKTDFLKPNDIYTGYSECLMSKIEPSTIALSVWSPPYNVGKNYEKGQSFEEWKIMIEKVISIHKIVLKEGGFMVINIADILCFPDTSMPKIQLSNPSLHKINITKEQILEAKSKYPLYNRRQLGKLLGCSEQTIDRRLNGVNIRGGKYSTQSRVQLIGNIIQEFAQSNGLYLYDRRIWHKDPAWANSKWTSNSYKSVDEFEYLYIFWKPGEIEINKKRLSSDEWRSWGCRAVWKFPSVRNNDIHEAMFPVELPLRCISLFTDEGDIVLDPFMGSGSTAIACINSNRKFIGLEKELKYVELAKERIKNHLANYKKSESP
ncbi:MAG: site-specific DNA-methyltransferase [Rikenellaceae bacterium]